MNAAKYLFALWVGIGFYVFLSLTYGEAGFSAYRQLEAERDKQNANLERLTRINKELENELNALKYDSDAFVIRARDLGLASPYERFIRIVGLGGLQRHHTEPGQIYTAIPPEFVSNKTIRIISFCVGFSILICMGVFDFLRYLQEK